MAKVKNVLKKVELQGHYVKNFAPNGKALSKGMYIWNKKSYLFWLWSYGQG